MEEIFELIKAFNRLKEKITELISKVDLLIKSQPDPLSGEYLDEGSACKFLHVSPRTLARMRSNGTITYLKQGKKVLYRISDLKLHLEKTSLNN